MHPNAICVDPEILIATGVWFMVLKAQVGGTVCCVCWLARCLEASTPRGPSVSSSGQAQRQSELEHHFLVHFIAALHQNLLGWFWLLWSPSVSVHMTDPSWCFISSWRAKVSRNTIHQPAIVYLGTQPSPKASAYAFHSWDTHLADTNSIFNLEKMQLLFIYLFNIPWL